jgi:hypothetical protein
MHHSRCASILVLPLFAIAACSSASDPDTAADGAAAVDGETADATGETADATGAPDSRTEIPDAPLGRTDAADDLPDATTSSADAAPADGGVTGVVLIGGVTTAVAGHTTYVGSSNAIDSCPTGEVLTGLRGRLRGTYNGPIWGACRPLALLADPLGITTGEAVTLLPEHGDALDGDTDWSRDCPEGSMMVGFEGRAGAIIDQLVFACAPLAVTAEPPHVVTVGSALPLELVGGTGGAAFAPVACPTGQVATGINTYFNGDPGFGLPHVYLDGAGLVCATPALQ